MKKISPDEFKNLKSSDTIIIYGCGYSINKLNDNDKLKHANFDSIGFNFFCKSGIPTTFYVVREQGNIKKRRHADENPKVLFELLNKHYPNTTLIIHDQFHHSPKALLWHNEKVSKNFCQNAIVIKDIKLKKNDAGVSKWGNTDMFKEGLIHGEMSLNNVLHFSIQMKYKRIIFSGIDLHDSRYFWLGAKENRKIMLEKGKKYYDKHPKASEVLKVVKNMKKLYNIDMFVYNKDSLLSKVIPVWVD